VSVLAVFGWLGRLNEENGTFPYLGLVILIVTAFLIYKFELVTQVHKDGVYIKLLPIRWKFKKIGFEQIANCYARKYRPIVEYGGWGIRWGISGRAYNAYGNMGVQLELRGGKRLLIGSQNADKLAEIINDTMRRT
jgi:hypothetical protein